MFVVQQSFLWLIWLDCLHSLAQFPGGYHINLFQPPLTLFTSLQCGEGRLFESDPQSNHVVCDSVVTCQSVLDTRHYYHFIECIGN